MQLIGEDYTALPNSDEATECHHWEYNIKERDFFLCETSSWHRITGTAYHIGIGKDTLIVPANYHVMIADVYGDLDWIKVDEIVGRTFDAFLMTNTLEENAWQIETMEVIDCVEDFIMVYPQTKNPVPVSVGTRFSILVSPADLYNKMSDYCHVDVV